MKPEQPVSLEEKTVQIDNQKAVLITIAGISAVCGILIAIATFLPLELKSDNVSFFITFMAVVICMLAIFAIGAFKKLKRLMSDLKEL